MATAVAAGGRRPRPRRRRRKRRPDSDPAENRCCRPVETITARSATTTLTVQATDGTGATLAGVDTRATVRSRAKGKTAEDGSVKFQRMQAGT